MYFWAAKTFYGCDIQRVYAPHLGSCNDPTRVQILDTPKIRLHNG